MKQTFRRLTQATTVTAWILAMPAMAQDKIQTSPDSQKSAPETSAAKMREERIGRSSKASDVIGMEVRNYQGDKLGKVEDLAIDLEAGRIVQVVVSTGGFLGIGDTLVAVPPGALHNDSGDKFIQLNADKESLKSAPKFGMAEWNLYSSSNRVSEVYRFFGEPTYFSSVSTNNWNTSLTPTPVTGPASRFAWSQFTLGYVQKASQLMGTEVKNYQDEKLGKVDNFVLDLSAGRIIAIIVSSGGFLGIGGELSAVPPSALQFNRERSVLSLDASKEALSSAPHFKSDEWPDLSQPGYSYTLYQAYHVEPYFTTNAVTAADSSAKNTRDRGGKTLTPFDQGNSASDRDRTAQIRKGIIKDQGMSMNARNVKIITVDGQVTLRGPVDTAEEKRLIGVIANDIALVGNVDNQLEIK